jgi:hypothetical protein
MAVAPTPKILRYPTRRIEESDDFLSIQIVKYQQPGFGGITGENLSLGTSSQFIANSINSNPQNILQTIYLPIPQNIDDQRGIAWGEDSLNTVQALLASGSIDVLTSKSIIGGVVSEAMNMGKAVNNAAQSGAAQNEVQANIGAAAANLFGGNVSPDSIRSRASGKVLNPHMELLFKGVSLRSFSFSFDFAPRDLNEANTIKQIIRSFKKNMSPQQGSSSSAGGGAGGIFINTPNVFQLEYKTGGSKHPFLNSFKPMALLNMGVNYTGSGTYATYEDATPVHMQMNLSFQELNPVYFEDYNDSDIGVGY